MLKLNSIFESIQGEGRYSGVPVLFIRLAGCNRKCEFCDTDFSTNKVISIKSIVGRIKKSKMHIVVWTGGEPTLQLEHIKEVIIQTPTILHHLETNGDNKLDLSIFDYVSFSPKSYDTLMKRLKDTIKLSFHYDIKVVTDLKLYKSLLPYATIIMPLTTFDKKKDEKIKRDVWDYCVKHPNIYFSLRQHIEVWGGKDKK